MKISISLIISWLFLANGNLSGQQNPYGLCDDLNTTKENVLQQYLSMNGKLLSMATCNLEPDTFLLILNRFRKKLQSATDSIEETRTRDLALKDLDYYYRNLVANYQSLYGMDSMALQEFERWMIDNKGSPDYENEFSNAFCKINTKELTAGDKSRLGKIILEKGMPDDGLLYRHSAAYRDWIDYYLTNQMEKLLSTDTSIGPGRYDQEKLELVNKICPHPFIRECVTYKLVKELLSMEDSAPLQEYAFQHFMTSATNTAARKEMTTIKRNNESMISNGPAPDFSYVDTANNTVSLKNLRGKFVFIDIWATWCVPCKAELPSLKKVIHDYQEKNILFLSISVDAQKDRDKWKKYIKEHQPGGIQLMADKAMNSAFITQFNILSIPRFILIDPKGRIFSGNAPRPSDPELRVLLNKIL